jgi:hypothetical protein
MKSKTTKSALIVFNDNKATANKKADIAMKSFKKKLPKAQTGIIAGPMDKSFQNSVDKATARAYAAQKANIKYGPKGDFDKAYATDMAQIKEMENQGRQYEGRPYQKKGGATKSTKFAALAPPYNKATAADRIAGAKKNARKK